MHPERGAEDLELRVRLTYEPSAGGTPTHELQRLGGWRSPVMVERYAHLAPDHLARAASRIDPLLGGYDFATPEKGKESATDANPL